MSVDAIFEDDGTEVTKKYRNAQVEDQVRLHSSAPIKPTRWHSPTDSVTVVAHREDPHTGRGLAARTTSCAGQRTSNCRAVEEKQRKRRAAVRVRPTALSFGRHFPKMRYESLMLTVYTRYLHSLAANENQQYVVFEDNLVEAKSFDLVLFRGNDAIGDFITRCTAPVCKAVGLKDS
jgi:hypothetical protein